MLARGERFVPVVVTADRERYATGVDDIAERRVAALAMVGVAVRSLVNDEDVEPRVDRAIEERELIFLGAPAALARVADDAADAADADAVELDRLAVAGARARRATPRS